MKNKAKVTISRRSNMKMKGDISISISDRSSGLNIVNVIMTPADFAEALTGLAHSDAEILRPPTQDMLDNLGKKKEVKDIFVDKSELLDGRDAIKKAIDAELFEPEWYGWHVLDYGTSTQQNGTRHRGVMCRYV